MVDVHRNDGASGGDFAADEFGRDLGGNALRKFAEDGRREFAARELAGTGVLLVQVGANDVIRHVGDLRAAHVLANGDEFHLRRDDASAGVLQLRDNPARFGTQRTAATALEPGKFHETILLRHARELGVFAGEIAVVLRLHFATVVFLHVATFQDPIAAQRGQTFVGVADEIRIAPRAGAIIDAHGRIFLNCAGVRFGVAHFDLAHRHTNIGVNCASHENFFARGQLFAAVRFE